MTKKTRKTHKMRKILLTVCCAALLVCVTIGATVAYLTATDTVTNTFTVGKLAMTMDEAKVTEYGVVMPNEDRVAENSYKLLPGHPYVKDPTIHFAWDGTNVVNSEAAYLFVAVKNELANIEAAEDTTYKKIATQITNNQWTELTRTGATDGYTVYYKTVNAASAKTDYAVFSSFKTTGTLSNDTNAALKISDYDNKKIYVKAYAIQADGFTTADAAWTAGNWNPAA